MTLTLEHDVVVDDDALSEYALGNLSPAKHIMMACQSEISGSVAERIAFQENLAASFIEEAPSESLSPLFIGKALEKLPPQKCKASQAPRQPASALAPKSLRHMLGHGLRDMKWKSLVPGVAVHDILGNRKTKEGDRLYLLRAKGGMRMPEHSHNGEEWTLVLTGSYTAGGQRYARGDMHIEGEDESHSPYIDEGEDCICLVMTQGPLKMQGWLPKAVQRVVGI